MLFVQNYEASADDNDGGVDDEDYEYYYIVDDDENDPDRAEPVVTDPEESSGQEIDIADDDLVIRITLKMGMPWKDALGMFFFVGISFAHYAVLS